MSRIFICYRRKDSPYAAHLLYERLVAEFGTPEVFMDVADLEPGGMWRQAIYQRIHEAQVFLAVIGDRWYELLHQKQIEAADNADPDVVEREIQTAQEAKKTVLPLLVGEARSEPSRLTRRIKTLFNSNHMELRAGSDLDHHLERVVDVIRRFFAMEALELVPIEQGTFVMGANADWAGSDEKPAHVIRIVRPFEIGKKPVTIAKYSAVVETLRSAFTDCPDNPVNMISWREAIEFCNLLSDRVKLDRFYEIDPSGAVRIHRKIGMDFGCQRKRNGNSPVALEVPHVGSLETTSMNFQPTHISITQPSIPRNRHRKSLNKLASWQPTRLGYAICTATSGNGFGMATTTSAIRRIKDRDASLTPDGR